MGYQVARNIREWSLHEWKTTIQEVVGDNSIPVPFPSIFICNVNRLKWSKTQEYDMTLDMINYMFYQLQNFTGYLSINESALSAENIFDKIAPSCEDMFIGDRVKSNFCKESNITPISTLEYGRCQRYDPNSSSYYFGSNGGLTLMLNAQTDDYIPLIGNNYLGEGLMLQVSYSGEEMGQWIRLTPGMRTSVAMQIKEQSIRKEEKSMLNPFAYFVSDPHCAENPKLLISNTTRYTSINSWLDCSFEFTFPICNCIPYFQVKGYRTCEIEEMLKCQDWSKYNISEVELTAMNDSFNQCVANIREPCSATLVDVQLSTTHFPSKRQNDSWEKYAESEIGGVTMTDLILLDVYFRTFDVKLTERYEVMSFDNLISSSGGLIGLWAGMSFLTVFQAIGYLIVYFKKVKNSRFKTKTTKVDRSQSF
uniref:Uncharacterized protein n=1 Tax=Plectus sambesii TaxID=2011161 RepID=A0A914VRD1_9BILA